LPSDEVAVSNIERNWDISRLVEKWRMRPESIPKVLIGIHGKPSHRFIVGALEINRVAICDPENLRYAKRWSQPRWQIPLIDRESLDFENLRGRRVAKIRFGQFSHQLHIWVDQSGRKRHPI